MGPFTRSLSFTIDLGRGWIQLMHGNVSTPTLLSWKFLQDFASRKNMCARKKGITKERKEGSVSSGNRKK